MRGYHIGYSSLAGTLRQTKQGMRWVRKTDATSEFLEVLTRWLRDEGGVLTYHTDSTDFEIRLTEKPAESAETGEST